MKGDPAITDLRDKTLLVTGATGSIGIATVDRLLRGGARVVASGSRQSPPDDLIGLADADHLSYLPCDLREESQVAALLTEGFSGRGLDGAVNVAGVVGDSVRTADYDAERWQKVIDINLRGTWLCLKHEIRAMLEVGGGAIVNVASIAGLVGEVERSPYVASKAGIVGLTKTAAVEYAEHGVRINVISPGPIDTPQFHLDVGGPGSPRYDRVIGQIPLRRMGLASEVAEAAAWLLSESASFVIGHELVVDGGLTVEGVQA